MPAFQANADLFDDVDAATVTLGVGKNMVQAIRYWMRAAQLIDAVDNHPTALGEFLFDIKEGEDPFLEDQGTLWVVALVAGL